MSHMTVENCYLDKRTLHVALQGSLQQRVVVDDRVEALDLQVDTKAVPKRISSDTCTVHPLLAIIKCGPRPSREQ